MVGFSCWFQGKLFAKDGIDDSIATGNHIDATLLGRYGVDGLTIEHSIKDNKDIVSLGGINIKHVKVMHVSIEQEAIRPNHAEFQSLALGKVKLRDVAEFAFGGAHEILEDTLEVAVQQADTVSLVPLEREGGFSNELDISWVDPVCMQLSMV